MFSSLNKISATLLLATFLAVTIVPVSSFAQTTGLIPCGTETYQSTDTLPTGKSVGDIKNPCGFNDAVKLVTNIISWLIYAGTVLSAIVFVYVGWLYLSAGGDEGKVKKAKEILWKVIWGFVIMVAAWLIIKTIETTLIGDSGIKSFLK